MKDKNVAQEQASTAETVVKPDLSLDGELNLSDYVQSSELSSKTVRELHAWTAKRKEATRSALAKRLVTIFSGTLAVTVLLPGVAAFHPGADKALIKDIVAQVITPQTALLGVVLGYYFSSKEEK